MGADYEKANKCIVAGSTRDAQAANTTAYYAPYGVSTNGGGANVREAPCPVNGVLEHLYVRCQLAPGVGETFTFAVQIGGVVTALTAQIAGAALTATDLVNQVAITAGQTIGIRVISSLNAAVTRLEWGWVIRT